MQCWMFATPIVYPASVVPERYRFWLGSIDGGFVETFRASLLGLPVPWAMVALSTAVTVLLGIGGWRSSGAWSGTSPT